jgi:predicted TPR repeat methyltransferase
MSIIHTHDDFAADYDRLAREYRCFIPEALFGLCFEYVHPHERLLDVGIGTGLAAWPFAKAGLEVSGIDASSEMLNICKSKDLAVELKQYDLRMTPWPYAANSFDHVVSCGLLHFFDNLEPVFGEIARMIRAKGIFAFTTKAPPIKGGLGATHGKYCQEVIDGVPVFSHRREYIEELIVGHGFEPLKELRLWVGNGHEESEGLFFAFVTRKSDD